MTNLGITVYGCEQDEADLFNELSARFGVVPTITTETVSEASAVSAPRNRCISVGHKSEISGRELRALKQCGAEYVSTRSIGVDHIDLDAAEKLGIAVEHVVYAPDGVADYTLMLMLLMIRNAKEIVSSAARADFRMASVRGKDLRDMTVGVVGVGNIGEAVIARLRGFGCRVLACNNRPKTATAQFVSLQELLAESDIVTLHVPLNSETRHLIGRRQLDSMKRGAFLVNTGRGALVDTKALIAALDRGSLGGAALDVLEGEEGLFYFDCTTRPIDNQFLLRLQEMPNAIVTPHTAYYTGRALRDTVENTLTNCLKFERNRANGESSSRDSVRGLLGGT
jgi:D-specific alpha-keto acid dehydrogenase